jgi:hypothetical protein
MLLFCVFCIAVNVFLGCGSAALGQLRLSRKTSPLFHDPFSGPLEKRICSRQAAKVEEIFAGACVSSRLLRTCFAQDFESAWRRGVLPQQVGC